MAIATIAGIAVAGSPGIAALIGLIFTFQSVQATNTQLNIAEQGQITDRYNAAITNLGSSSIEVRLGGIYALQRLMQDSPRDQPTVVAVLCAFVRNQTPHTVPPAKPSDLRPPPTDIQAALTVVGTRHTANDGSTTVIDFDHAQLANVQLQQLQLSGADFSGADLTGAIFLSANLTSAHLPGANLTSADLELARLTGADLTGADLDGADLDGADLEAVFLSGANLTGATLDIANLTGASLDHANLTGARLDGANLSDADLRDANLTGVTGDLGSAKLTGANLTGAEWPKNVPAPDDWVRDPGSGLVRRVSAGA